MRTPILALATLATLPSIASAQSATFTWHWNRASDPITEPAPAALQPGESARIWLDVAWDPGAIPNVRGLGSIFYDMIATDAQGSWVTWGTGFGGTQMSNLQNFNFNEWGHRQDLLPTTASAWYLPVIVPTSTYDPATGSLLAFQAGQIGAPGTSATVSSANPVIEIWRGMFTPQSYTPRTISYTGQKATASPSTGVTLYTKATGQAFFETLPIPHANINFGSLQIPVIPSPPTLALLGLTALLATRRRRCNSAPPS